MRAVVARVSSASVSVDGEVVGEIDEPGLLVLVGVTHHDNPDKAMQLAQKLFGLRVLRNEDSCESIDAPMLVVSQFTLYGETTRGRRPSWTKAAPGPIAEPLYEAVVTGLKELGARVQTGVFGAEMAVTSVNDGPFTLVIDL